MREGPRTEDGGADQAVGVEGWAWQGGVNVARRGTTGWVGPQVVLREVGISIIVS